VRAVEDGYPQREIANSAYQFQRAVDAGERVIVGVNKYITDRADHIPTLKIEHEVERSQRERATAIIARRDAAKAQAALSAVRHACQTDENLFPPILDAVRNDVTLGEICQVFREVFGEHRDPAYL
jgi:methylmalonyl-CoA mutase N-terminal domain/subunit